jgi:hypothetical protein
MQIARFDHSGLIGFIRICGSAEAVRLCLKPTRTIWNDAFLLHPRKDLVFMEVIGETIGSMEITLFHDEPTPSVTDALYVAEIPFSIHEHQGSQPLSQAIYDVRKNRKQTFADAQGNTLLMFANEEYRIIDIPSGNYQLTVHQQYTEKIPLALLDKVHPEAIANAIKRINKPVQLCLYFNPVESLNGIVARELWNWPDGINIPGMQSSWHTVHTFVQSGNQEESPHQLAKEQGSMITTLSELASLLEKTPFADHETTVLEVEDHRVDDGIIIEAKTGDIEEHKNQSILFIEIKHNEGMALWNTFKSLLDKTGRWPVLSVLYRGLYENSLREQNPNTDWKETLAKVYTFPESPEQYYEEHKSQYEYTKRILHELSPEKLISERVDRYNVLKTEILKQEEIEKNLKYTVDRVGKAPSQQEILELVETERIITYIDLERWLLDWETELVGIDSLTPNTTEDVDWYVPPEQELVLLLIPSRNSWETCEHHLPVSFGMFHPEYIVVLKHWHEKYGADMIANYKSALLFTVKQPPENIEDAFQLALEHAAFSFEVLDEDETVLPPVSVRHRAQNLLTARRWVLYAQQ